MSADPTHSHAEFHRGLVPEAQLASGTATAGYVPTATGAGTAAWGPGGGSSPSWPVLFTYDTTTANADPGSGKFRLNNATIASATALYIDNLDANANDVSAWIASWDVESWAIRGYLRLRSVANPGAYATFRITSYTPHAGYSEFALTLVANNGAIGTGAANIAVDFWPNAYPGDATVITFTAAHQHQREEFVAAGGTPETFVLSATPLSLRDVYRNGQRLLSTDVGGAGVNVDVDTAASDDIAIDYEAAP